MVTYEDIKIGNLYILRYPNYSSKPDRIVLVLYKDIQEFSCETFQAADFLFLDDLKRTTYFLDRLNDSFELIPLNDEEC